MRTGPGRVKQKMFGIGKKKGLAITPEDLSQWAWVETGPTTMEAEWDGYVFRTEFHTFRNMHSFTCRPTATSPALSDARPKWAGMRRPDLLKKIAKEASKLARG